MTTITGHIAEEIRVCGIVQGVGFRPTVYRLALDCGLCGEVSNDGEGVLIRVVGDRNSIDTLIHRLQTEPPPLAKIESISRSPYTGKQSFSNFTIVSSKSNKIRTKIAPDAATCPACQQDIFDPLSRFYRYPFTNCTHCGPRLSLIKKLPYDRENTSMAGFKFCGDCQQDYEEPVNRRFHAQPIACHFCGPKVTLERADGKPVTAHMFSMLDEVDAVCTLLQRGQIVAIKGLGGFHLACDATNEEIVQKLRLRKRRPDKPLALMARDINIIENHCFVTPEERELLESSAAPIVLLRRKKSLKDGIAASVAPHQNYLGFMLPYTPLHHLALRRLEIPIVLTSANFSDDPQCIDNAEVRSKLYNVADYFILHNREIVNRVDDSVVRISNNRLQILRRARGYAPAPINLHPEFKDKPAILAMGSELKNTFCLLREGQAILSQHIGDLENALAAEAYQKTLNLYLGLLEHQPSAIAVDLHPEYLSTKLGKELAESNNIPIDFIQHHHAHIAACMAENGLSIDTKPVLGIALDGLGYGDDGTIWGGEFLLADYRSFKRLGTFKPVEMIGGEQAIYQPWRNTYAHLKAAFGEDLTSQVMGLRLGEFLVQQPLKLLDQLITKQINSPLASSCGRLFDAVAGAIGICRESCSYEGQAAITLEAIAEDYLLNYSEEIEPYPFLVRKLECSLLSIEPRPMWFALLTDLRQTLPVGMMAAKFHLGLAEAIAMMVERLSSETDFHQVILTGGVFQNQVLLTQVCKHLTAKNLEVLTHSQVPANDGGLSLGQAVIAAAKLEE
ncbi:carbamoyltransferase HypF [Limnoraphis robusta]|uniref:Carbamoyltransferase n=1 Tax=Limnoraphis robusta CCNP1315 TaxID=3110306 RepID=A0ABU5TSW9_9CYAN|nr:carbamoyltransferase HypF [Limnoraphis robusta]MEA5518002.1 carbamoyltransferase HypF [Limnoraphis robusta CCNP1315]MEA5547269.1 carbamoyltransferase HypF [Limnoraphis robusta CCNP1324]